MLVIYIKQNQATGAKESIFWDLQSQIVILESWEVIYREMK